MWRLRGWILMGFLSVVLLIVVAVPAAYQQNADRRRIFVAVMIPVVWVIYLTVFYLCLYRPLRRSMELYKQGCSHNDGEANSHAYFWVKEQKKLNEALKHLRVDTENLTRLTSRWESSSQNNWMLTSSAVYEVADDHSFGSPDISQPK
ncbi:uncharacterized protein TM35_000045320 [Trypanosoma theileri]|uniref:Uncharacterized protein n=1 Tax=Trypanosoma theileri TaxID=67003 RepID=A0A1X0P639_9TRYP|nr:uncharacterized protein TM35_000045320 [Trypanosoma theileri]ORC92318.1 hypothetical protein TM35_000045320 [Trypanosoma theileri]